MPSKSTFSRFLDKLTKIDELEKLFYQLVAHAIELNIINGEHVSIDSTKLDFYEAAKPKKFISDDGIPIIAYNPRGSYAPPLGLDEEF